MQAPLASWRLAYFVSGGQWDRVLGRTARFGLMVGLCALGGVLVALAAMFYRAHTRAMHEAALRVSFVNRVSHELKTPLTNIRLYAELLDRDLADADTSTRERLHVVVAEGVVALGKTDETRLN